MKKIRIIAMLTLLTIVCGNSLAQKLVLHHANGSTTEVELFTMPRVTFEGDKVVVKSSVVNLEYDKADILRFTYGINPTGINSRKSDVKYSREDGKIVFRDIRPQDNITLYTVDGVRVPVSVNRSGDGAELLLSSLTSGVYILNVNGQTSKITLP